MTVSINSTEKIDSSTWLVKWSSDLTTPTFRIYRDSVLIKTTTQTQETFQVVKGESLLIEIRDDLSTPSLAYPGQLTLSWLATPATEKYKIEELVSSVWTLRAEITHQGQGSFKWVSRFLEDVTTHQFRITPVGKNGNEGTPKNFSSLMVRHPDVPAKNFGYDGSVTKTVTIT